mgnify:CR=1 FL=1
MHTLSIITFIIGSLICITNLAFSLENFILATDRRRAPECYRGKLVKSDVLRGVSSFGKSIFWFIIAFLPSTPISTPMLIGALIFNVLASLFNYFFVSKNKLEEEIKRIDTERQGGRKISIFHDYEDKYYSAIKDNIRDRNTLLILAILLGLILIVVH